MHGMLVHSLYKYNFCSPNSHMGMFENKFTYCCLSFNRIIVTFVHIFQIPPWPMTNHSLRYKPVCQLSTKKTDVSHKLLLSERFGMGLSWDTALNNAA